WSSDVCSSDLGHVEFVRDEVTALGGLWIEVDDGVTPAGGAVDPGARAEEGLRDRRSDPARGAGDEGDPTVHRVGGHRRGGHLRSLSSRSARGDEELHVVRRPARGPVDTLAGDGERELAWDEPGNGHASD